MVLTFLIHCYNVVAVGVVPLLNMSCHILISTSIYPLFDLIQKTTILIFPISYNYGSPILWFLGLERSLLLIDKTANILSRPNEKIYVSILQVLHYKFRLV